MSDANKSNKLAASSDISNVQAQTCRREISLDDFHLDPDSGANHGLKLHIDSNLIRSNSSILPDELKSLGVCAYDENDFEKGVLYQVDLQIAEYELHQAKRPKGKGAQPQPPTDDDQSTNDSTSKRPSSGEDDYSRKKARLESKIRDYNSYLNHDDESSSSSSSLSNDPDQASSSNKRKNEHLLEDMIKTGEMTPFGGSVDFDQGGKSKKHAKIDRKVSSLDVTTSTTSTDFDSFLFDLDRQKSEHLSAQKKKLIENREKALSTSNIKKQPPAKANSSDYKATNSTEFDLFLSDFDNKKPTPQPSKMKPKSKSSSSIQVLPTTSKAAPNTTSFDQFLQNLDPPTTNKISKSSLPKSDAAKKQPVADKKEKPMDKISFMRAILDSDSDQEEPVTSPTKPSKNTKSLFIFTNPDEREDEDEKEESNDDKNDPDYDKLTDVSDTSSVEYLTDDDEDDEESILDKKRRKRMLKRTCMDDGDDEVYQERMKKIETLEKSLLAEDLNDEEEEENIEGNLLEDQLILINNNRHVDIDGTLKVPEQIWNRLFKFQKTGLKWFWELHSQRCGGILGDEMGLGKTIQMIAYLAAMSYSKVRSVGFSYAGLGPVLIVAPVTLIGNWVKECHRWWPYFRVCVLHEIGTYQQPSKTKLIDKAFNLNGILITTYSSLLIYDRALLTKNWHYVILDEGHKIRNPDAKVCSCVLI